MAEISLFILFKFSSLNKIMPILEKFNDYKYPDIERIIPHL